MGINVTVDGLEAMPPAAIRNVATLLTLMADHIEQSVTGMPIRGEDAMQSRVIAPRVPIVTPDQPTSPSAAFAPPDNPTTQAPGIDVDAAGLPWDGRIHASSRALIADGTWRQRRNLDPAILATVTAELKQLMSLPAATSPAPAAVAPVPPAPSAALVPTPPLLSTVRFRLRPRFLLSPFRRRLVLHRLYPLLVLLVRLPSPS